MTTKLPFNLTRDARFQARPVRWDAREQRRAVLAGLRALPTVQACQRQSSTLLFTCAALAAFCAGALATLAML